jgi:hypothetical protein
MNNGDDMANLDRFSAQIVQYVRSLPDEALLELVRQHLGQGNGAASPLAVAAKRPGRSPGKPGRPPGRPKKAAAPAPAPAAAAPKPAKKKVAKKAAPKAAAGRQRSTAEERDQLLGRVEDAVKASKGVSASEVANSLKVPQHRVANALRELKGNKRIFQGGERRFARYAADAKTAKAASDRARKSASGPKRS